MTIEEEAIYQQHFADLARIDQQHQVEKERQLTALQRTVDKRRARWEELRRQKKEGNGDKAVIKTEMQKIKVTFFTSLS